MNSIVTYADTPQFINRVAEFEAISRRIACARAPEIILLRGMSGWGKSALAKKCLCAADGRPVVEVEVPQPNEALDTEAVNVLLASGLSALGERSGTVQTFDEFLLCRKGIEVAKQAATALVEYYGKRWLGNDAFEVLKKIGSSVVLRTAKGLPQDISDEVSIYVSKCLAKRPLGIRIENIQSMAPRALSALGRSLAESNGAYVIAEFTDDAPVIATQADEGIRIFELAGLQPWSYDLEKLSFDELCGAYQDRPVELIEILRSCYLRAGGNLHPLRQLEVIYAREPSRTRDEAPDAATAWHALTSSERMVAALVAAHGSAVDRELLGGLLTSPSLTEKFLFGFIDVNGCVARLTETLFLRDGPPLTIGHDSVATFLAEADSARKHMAIAAKAWFDFYKVALDQGDAFLAEAELLDWAAYFAAQLGDVTSVAAHLERMGGLALKTIAPRRLVDSFRQLRRRCLERPAPGIDLVVGRIARQQALLLYELGWMPEALEALDALCDQDDAMRLLRAELLCSGERFQEGVEALDDLLDTWEALPEPPSEKISLARIIRIHGLRNKGAFNQCRSEYLNLLERRPFQSAALDRAVLRYADVALASDTDDAQMTKLLGEALLAAEHHPRDEAAVRIALAQHLWHKGAPDAASFHLDRVQEISRSHWFQRYVLLNNQAVLAAGMGNLGSATELLAECLPLAIEATDTAIIRMNMMSAKCLSGDDAAALAIGVRLSEFVECKENEPEVRRCVAFNLHVLYRRKGDLLAAEYFLTLAREIHCEVDEGYWEAKFQVATDGGTGADVFYLMMMCIWYLSAAPFESVVQ